MTPYAELLQQNAKLRQVNAELMEEVRYLRDVVSTEVEAARLVKVARALDLTGQEAWLLLALYRNPTRVHSKGTLNDAMPTRDAIAPRTDKIVDVFVCKVRRKLGDDVIKTIWGKGYQIGDRGVDVVERVLAGNPVILTPRAKRPRRPAYGGRLAAWLAANPGATSKQAAAAFGVRQESVSTTFRAWADAGWLVRERSSSVTELGHAPYRHTLTEAGRRRFGLAALEAA